MYLGGCGRLCKKKIYEELGSPMAFGFLKQFPMDVKEGKQKIKCKAKLCPHQVMSPHKDLTPVPASKFVQGTPWK